MQKQHLLSEDCDKEEIAEIIEAEIAAERAQWEADRDGFRRWLEEIQMCANAYPLSVFPEPDLVKAHAALQSVGMTLDAVSASVIRLTIERAQEITANTLGISSEPGEEKL